MNNKANYVVDITEVRISGMVIKCDTGCNLAEIFTTQHVTVEDDDLICPCCADRLTVDQAPDECHVCIGVASPPTE